MTGPPGKPRHRLTGIAICVGLVLSCYGYLTGWPTWKLLLLIFAAPAVSFGLWMYTGRFRHYRFLFGIYSVAFAAGLFEAWQYERIPESLAKSIELPLSPGEPNLFFEYDLPGIMIELFPNDADSLLISGRQYQFCVDLQHRLAIRRHPFCEKYSRSETDSMRDLFERALATEPKLNQNAYYNYVEILIHENASQSDIDAATLKWRQLFPLSTRPDPRDFFGLGNGKAPN